MGVATEETSVGCFWFMCENVSSHKTQRVRDFLVRYGNVRMHFTPTYSSWLNQVENWFSRIQRDVITCGVFTSLQDRQAVVVNEQFDTARHARLAADQSIAFEMEHHLMDGRCGDTKKALHITLSRCAGVDQSIGPDESQILALLVGEPRAA